MAESNPDRIPEKIKKTDLKKEKGYLYYIDEDGDVARVPAKWNKDPKFIEKVKEVPKNMEIHESQNIAFDDAKPLDGDLVYEDKICEAKVKDKPLTTGHIRAKSKEEGSLRDINVEALNQLMTISSISASLAFESLKAAGTNIILTQRNQIEVSVIPRFENDGLELMWEMKQGDQNQIKGIAEQIKSKLVIGEIQDFSKVNFDEPSDKKVNIVDPLPPAEETKETNYLIEQLRRIP